MITPNDSQPTNFKCTPRALASAIDLFASWQREESHLPLDRIVEAVFRASRFLNSGERRWIGDAIYASVRFLRRDTALLAAHQLPDTPENRLRLYATEPLTLQTAEGILLLQTIADVLPSPENPAEYLRTTLSFPDEMADELEALLGTEAPQAAEAFNQQAATVLRVNTLKARRHPVLYEFPDSQPTRYSPWGVELASRVNLPAQPNFKAGHYEIQEEASQLAVLLTNAKPNETIIEVGAGGGGKTLALAALMENHGRIVAIDSIDERLTTLSKRARRAGASGVEMLTLPADSSGLWQPLGNSVRRMERLTQSADCVLIDAPCTGSGVLRRTPDVKWRTGIPKTEIATVQQSLMQQSARLVKPNGMLIYVTCAIERWQNENIVAAFMESDIGREYQVENPIPRLQTALRRFGVSAENQGEGLASFAQGEFIRTYPHRHRMDAFFMACLRRNSSQPR